jgi:hypothetical protein
MENDKIIFWRNMLFRTFLIGMGLAIILAVLILAFWHTWEIWVVQLFRTDEKELGRVVLTFFMNVRLILVFLILAPALALHTMKWKKRK